MVKNPGPDVPMDPERGDAPVWVARDPVPRPAAQNVPQDFSGRFAAVGGYRVEPHKHPDSIGPSGAEKNL